MGHEMKRREFLGKTTLGILSAGCTTPFLSRRAVSQEKEPKIIYRTLGRTNLRIPIVSFGVMNSDSPDLIKRACYQEIFSQVIFLAYPMAWRAATHPSPAAEII
jgi:hypothetical protein